MPKVTGGITAAIVVLLLTGCAGTVEPAATGTAGVGTEQVGPTATDAPLVAETQAPDENDPEALFIEKFHELRDGMAGETFIPNATDDQLIAAGWSACEQIRGGTDPAEIRLVEGETPNGADIYADSSALMNAALLSLCPELV